MPGIDPRKHAVRCLLLAVPDQTVEALRIVDRAEVVTVALQDRLLVEHAEVGRHPDLADLCDRPLSLATRQQVVGLAQLADGGDRRESREPPADFVIARGGDRFLCALAQQSLIGPVWIIRDEVDDVAEARTGALATEVEESDRLAEERVLGLLRPHVSAGPVA